ncbi:hypothetical protein [Pseudomonas sp. 58(2021)]|uniref:hypothetical protein n=1 Tax=Pseudomonas sp. 58(2021) TaxID=2813330 RepID=UPI001A9D66B2|nr:hypothetical protein [Pseudomonas sp. 58(2021)]
MDANHGGRDGSVFWRGRKKINKIERYNADGPIDKKFCGVGYITLDGVPGSAVAASLALTTDNRVAYLVKDIWASDSIVRILA